MMALDAMTSAPPATGAVPLDDAVAKAAGALTRHQRPDGHFVFELEADATIPAEYVLLEHFLDRIDAPLQQKIGVYLRAIQGEHGGWPLFHDGAFNISCSVKAYFALKAIGDDPEPRTCAARARRSWPPAGRSGRMYLRGPSWRCSARCRGARCR